MSFFGTISGLFSQPKTSGQPVRRIPQPVPIKPQPQQAKKVAPVQPQKNQPQPAQQKPVMDDTMIREAQARAREIIVEAKDEALALREKAEREARALRQEISDKERSLDQKLASIDARLRLLDDRDKELANKKAQLEKTQQDLEDLRQQLIKKLEHVAGLTREQAKAQVLENLEKDLSKRCHNSFKLLKRKQKKRLMTKHAKS
jgi:hypothetical protein